MLICNSCTQKQNYDGAISISFDSYGQEIMLTGTDVEFDMPLMKPRRLFIIDSVLLVQNTQTQYIIHKYNLNTLKKTGECIPFGSGPNELLWVHKIQNNGQYIWLIDTQRQSCLKFLKSDICNQEACVSVGQIRTKEHFGDAIILPDNRLLATVLNISQKRFSFFSEEGNLLNTIGEFPDYGEELKPLEKIEGFDGELLLGVDGIKFFFFHKQTDLIDVFDLSGSLIRRFHGPEHFMPHVKEKDYDNGTKVHSIPNVSKDAYFCPTLCGNEIYVLYSGKFYDPQINTYLHDQILVFDKEGNPLRRYRLSVPIFTFTVDMATRTIYGLSDDPDFRLVKFDIDS